MIRNGVHPRASTCTNGPKIGQMVSHKGERWNHMDAKKIQDYKKFRKCCVTGGKILGSIFEDEFHVLLV